MEDVESGEALTEVTVESEVRGGVLWLGDAIHFFLSAKRAGGRSGKTVDDYRKKQRTIRIGPPPSARRASGW